MMFAVHTRRLQPHAEANNADRVLRWCLEVEPYIAASFLFIAGHSLVLAQRAGALDQRKLLWRAAILYALAVVLFVPQYGIAFPDLLFSPGILSAIAVSVVVVGALVKQNAADLVIATLAASVLLATHWLGAPGRSVSGLDAGPGGVFPLVAFTCFGAILARLGARYGARALAIAVVLSLPLFLFVWRSHAAWTTTDMSRYPAHSGQLALGTLFTRGGTTEVPFWNHSALGALGLAFPLSASLGFFVGLPKSFTGARWLAPLRLLGRHALGAYVGHLVVLGILELTGLTPKSAAGTWIVVALLAAASILFAMILDGSSPIARLGRRVYSQKT
jgi:uncharacterized membrane protein